MRWNWQNFAHGEKFWLCGIYYSYTPIVYVITDIRSDVGHRSKRAEFQNESTRKHFVTRQDIVNVRVNIKDLTIIRNQEDAVSVDMFVNELQKEPYNPILLYKRQHDSNPSYSSLPKESFVFAMQTVSEGLLSTVCYQDSMCGCYPWYQCLWVQVNYGHGCRWIWSRWGVIHVYTPKVVDIHIHVIHTSVLWITNRLSCCLVHSRPGEYRCCIFALLSYKEKLPINWNSSFNVRWW